MTLFACAAPDRPVFEQVLTQYFLGIPDSHTLRRLPPHATAAVSWHRADRPGATS